MRLNEALMEIEKGNYIKLKKWPIDYLIAKGIYTVSKIDIRDFYSNDWEIHPLSYLSVGQILEKVNNEILT